MYNVSVVMMRMSFSTSEARLAIACPESVFILNALANTTLCHDMVCTFLHMVLTDLKTRSIFGNFAIARLIIRILETNTNEDVLDNAVTAMFAFSKVHTTRVLLADTVNADMHLMKILQQEHSAQLKANCARTLKNMNSDPNEAIEEGTVAALIAMALDGKKTNVVDNLNAPNAIPMKLKDISLPQCGTLDVDAALWYGEKVIASGGSAGKGPDPPQPPPMTDDDSVAHPLLTDELDGGEMEGKTKMAFAKMQAPEELRSNFLLTEADFSPPEEVVEDEAAMGTQSPNNFADLDVADDVELSAGALDTNSRPSSRSGSPSPSQGGSRRESMSSRGLRSAKLEVEEKKLPKKKSFRSKVATAISVGDKAVQLGLYS